MLNNIHTAEDSPAQEPLISIKQQQQKIIRQII